VRPRHLLEAAVLPCSNDKAGFESASGDDQFVCHRSLRSHSSPVQAGDKVHDARSVAVYQPRHTATEISTILNRLRLEVRLQEPEVLVELARERGKDIDSDVIAEIAGFLDGSAQSVGVVRDIVDQPL